MNIKFTPLLLLCFFGIIFSQTGYSQKTECQTTLPVDYKSSKASDPIGYKNFLVEFKANQLTSRNGGSCINYAPIKAHIVRQSDGTGGLMVAELNDAIANMNTIYEPACLNFFLCGDINYIDDDTYYDFNKNDEAALTSANDVDNLINIYFCNSVGTDTSSSCGYAKYPGGQDIVLMDNNCAINGSTLPHEMGHFFDLRHTHNGGDELVDGSNCETAGDGFCDTEADPKLSTSIVNSSCVYTGTDMDSNNDLYMPNTHNIMSYSRKSCRDFFSVEQFATISFTFLYVRNYWACADFDVDFAVDEDFACASPLVVNFTEEAVGENTYAWDFNSDGVTDATTANPSYIYNAPGTYDVCLTISNGTNSISKVKTALINIGSTTFPYGQDVEGFVVASNATGYGDSWTTNPAGTTDEFRWNTGMDTTPTSNTGPSVDHTTGTNTGIYIFTEGSSGTTGAIAELISPCLDIPVDALDPSIRFWYHMYGSSMGILHIDLHDGSNWINDFHTPISGEQQTSSEAEYLEEIFSLNNYQGSTIQIRFRAERGTSFRGDMAIDDFEIFENGDLLPLELTNFEGRTDENGKHLLQWATAFEDQSSFFDIEHAMRGEEFLSIGLVDAMGNSLVNNNYSYTNRNPEKGNNYYRLKMVDLDGRFEYSSVISLNGNLKQTNFAIFPNPSRGHFTLEMNVDTHSSISVYNSIGQLIYADEWLKDEGTYALDLSTYANGVYTIQVSSKSEILAIEKLVKY